MSDSSREAEPLGEIRGARRGRYFTDESHGMLSAGLAPVLSLRIAQVVLAIYLVAYHEPT